MEHGALRGIAKRRPLRKPPPRPPATPAGMTLLRISLCANGVAARAAQFERAGNRDYLMTRRRLLVLAVALLAVVNVWLSARHLRNPVHRRQIETRDERPPVSKLEPVSIYPNKPFGSLLVEE